MARLIHDQLVKRHYSVFYDMESLTPERFDERILSEIESCSDFILILSKGCLDRCKNSESDWVRREIRHAILHSKHIVPILLRGFEFPSELPEDIAFIKNYHALEFTSLDLMDARIDQLCHFLDAQSKGIASSVKPLLAWFRDMLILPLYPIAWAGRLLWRIKPLRYLSFAVLLFCIIAFSVDIVQAQTFETAMLPENFPWAASITGFCVLLTLIVGYAVTRKSKHKS